MKPKMRSHLFRFTICKAIDIYSSYFDNRHTYFYTRRWRNEYFSRPAIGTTYATHEPLIIDRRYIYEHYAIDSHIIAYT